MSHIRLLEAQYSVQMSAKSTLSRLNATPEERAAREQKLATAVRTILECIGEDPDREGLVRTPERYAQALMWMTKGYEERLSGLHRVSQTYVPPHYLLSRRDQQRRIRRGPRRDGPRARHRHLQPLRAPPRPLHWQGKNEFVFSYSHFIPTSLQFFDLRFPNLNQFS